MNLGYPNLKDMADRNHDWHIGMACDEASGALAEIARNREAILGARKEINDLKRTIYWIIKSSGGKVSISRRTMLDNPTPGPIHETTDAETATIILTALKKGDHATHH